MPNKRIPDQDGIFRAFLWIILHTVAYPFFLLLGFISIYLFAFVGDLLPEILASGLGYVLWGAVIGAGMGLVQWLFLHGKTGLGARWILRSALGRPLQSLIGQ